jgi:Protein of unknown function (DUF4011)
MSETNLHAQIDEWRNRLLDLSKRNRLVNCKVGATGALEIAYPSPQVIWDQIVVNDGKMSFVWKRALLDEVDVDDSPQLSLFSGADEGKTTRFESSRAEMEECLASPFLSETHVLTQMTDRKLGSRLNRLSLDARTTIAETGMNVLYVAFGMLRWYESESSNGAADLTAPARAGSTRAVRAGRALERKRL